MKEEKILDKAMRVFMEKEIEAKRHKPFLDKVVRDVEQVDNKIEWYKNKIKEEENKKQSLLKKVDDLFELCLVSKHELPNGYKVMIDNRYKIEVQDVGMFLKWLKQHFTPREVLEFFEDSIKSTKLKSFCEKYINQEKMNGQFDSEINIDGVAFYDVTFRRLTTKQRKK